MRNIYLEFIKNMLTFAAQKTLGVAQLVAFLVWDQAVAGSSPVTSTKENGFQKNCSPFLLSQLNKVF